MLTSSINLDRVTRWFLRKDNSKKYNIGYLLNSKIKETAERLSGNRVWLEPAADLNEVARFIHSVRPRTTTTPLIRVGGDGDGGYLLPDDLDNLKVCISPGVSTNISFDLAMAKRGLHVFMVDASVDGPPERNDRFHFEKKNLDVFEDESNMRLDTLCASIPPELDGDRILQMDIEAAEYRVLLDASDEVLKSFRIMTIEFHHLTRLFGKFQYGIIKAAFDKLQRFHHIVHIHPNNVCWPTIRGGLVIHPVMEFTFHRKDQATLDTDTKLTFPHPLDADNLPNLPTQILPECWR